MPANDSLLKYLESMAANNEQQDNNEDNKEKETKKSPNIKINIKAPAKKKPEHSEHSDQVNDLEDIFSDIEYSATSNTTQTTQVTSDTADAPKRQQSNGGYDIDKFMEEARAMAASSHDSDKSKAYRISSKPVVTQEHKSIPGKPVIDPSQYSANAEDKDTSSGSQSAPSVTELLEQSETYFKDEWIEMYESGLKSKKRNPVADKIRAGKFRINKEHHVEILPDKSTYGKSANDLLHEHWDD